MYKQQRGVRAKFRAYTDVDRMAVNICMFTVKVAVLRDNLLECCRGFELNLELKPRNTALRETDL